MEGSRDLNATMDVRSYKTRQVKNGKNKGAMKEGDIEGSG